MVILLKDVYIRTALIISFLLVLIGLAAGYAAFADIDHLLVIHFDNYRGIDVLGYKSEVFGILWVGLAVNIINFFLAAVFYYRERFLSYLIVYFSAFFSLLILIAAGVIISIN